MTKINAWLNAARLRTLPLSVSGIVMGTALASFYGETDLIIFILALLTTIGFQVTSNFANDYGDGVKGTDNEDRIGPKRALQSGLLNRVQLKKGIFISILVCIFLVVAVVIKSFGTQNLGLAAVFLILGGLSIWAAIKYTVGSNAYGYRGLGDLFVFLFFGLLAVMGSMFLYTKFVTYISCLPAITIGALSAGVLNLNNMRDYESDKKAKKNTMIVKLGPDRGKQYHFFLIGIAMLSIIAFIILTARMPLHYLPFLGLIPIGMHLFKVYHTETPAQYDPELKRLALSTFLLAMLMFISYYKIL